ncbi:MAG: PaaI family thioesterase [candidate division NC10 bacterium]|nr:PaaI family thioesterase [candidate division NC10 bacterium]
MDHPDQNERFQRRIKGTFSELLGMRLLELKPGYVRGELPVRDSLKQPYGFLHGGAIATFADSLVAAGTGRLLAPGQTMTTIEFKVNFMAPVKDGTVRGEATVLHQGRRTMVWEVRLTDAGNRLVALMTTAVMILAPQDAPGAPPA